MFILKYFKNSILLKDILKQKDEKLWKVFIFFILICIISFFSYNFTAYQHGGFDFGNIRINVENLEFDGVVLPSGITINNSKMDSLKSKGFDELVINSNKSEYRSLKIVFDYDTLYEIKELKNQNILVLRKNDFLYGDNKQIKPSNYSSNKKPFSTTTFNQISKTEDKFAYFYQFSQRLDENLRKYDMPISIILFDLINLFTTFMLFIILAGLLMFIKFKYPWFLNYRESFKLLVFSMVWPAVVSFILGFIPQGFAFTPSVINFGVAIISFLILYYKGNKYFTIENMHLESKPLFRRRKRK